MKTSIKPLACEAAREMMFDYIDGELRESDSKRLLSHISECEECKRELSTRREILALIGSSEKSAPDALYNGVMEKIADIPQEKPNILKRFRFIPAAALVAACAMLTVFVVGRGYFLGGGDNMTSDAFGVGRADGYAVPEKSVMEADADEVISDEAAGEEILYCADVDAEAEVYTATTAAVTASCPGIMEDNAENCALEYAAAPTEATVKMAANADNASSAIYGKFDALYKKINVSTSGAAVIICAEGDISDISASLNEDVHVGDLSFTRYVIETDAARSFTEHLESLDKKGAPYRAAIPSDGDIRTCEIFVLRDSE